MMFSIQFQRVYLSLSNFERFCVHYGMKTGRAQNEMRVIAESRLWRTFA